MVNLNQTDRNNAEQIKIVSRETIFISKATPEDDDFVLWLAPRLEASGYCVYADILSLEAGDRWRRELTETLQERAAKMLLCCSDITLAKQGVQEEIGIAEDVARELNDPRFIIPLRVRHYKKVFGIGELHYVDFVGSWERGLQDLLKSLAKQSVPRNENQISISPKWKSYRARHATRVEERPEVLTSNWLRVAEIPDVIRYFQPSGALGHELIHAASRNSRFVSEIHHRGFFSFATLDEVQEQFADAGKFVVHSEHYVLDLLQSGSEILNIRPRDMRNLISAMFRKAWERFCRAQGLSECAFATQQCFFVNKDQIPIRKKITWRRKGGTRSSMLRNVSGGRVWQYGVSALPSFWPYPHFKIKARIVFATLSYGEAGELIDNPRTQHRLRRTICKGWRNASWHGRLMAFLMLMSGDSETIDLPVSLSERIRLDSAPITFRSPVTTSSPETNDEEG